jgi:hypothetical protein
VSYGSSKYNALCHPRRHPTVNRLVLAPGIAEPDGVIVFSFLRGCDLGICIPLRYDPKFGGRFPLPRLFECESPEYRSHFYEKELQLSPSSPAVGRSTMEVSRYQ